jgi:hypothetical protein
MLELGQCFSFFTFFKEVSVWWWWWWGWGNGSDWEGLNNLEWAEIQLEITQGTYVQVLIAVGQVIVKPATIGTFLKFNLQLTMNKK